MFDKIIIKPSGKLSEYTDIVFFCSIKSLPPSDYALLNAADGFLT